MTEVITYPRMRVLSFFLVGGDLEEILNEMEPKICEFGRAVRCTRVAQVGRPGWKKILAEHGYKAGLYATYKDL